MVDEVKIFDAKHLELRRSNNNASEMLATSEAKIRSKMEKRDALKSQLEKRINDVVYLPVVDKDRMVSRLRLQFISQCSENQKFHHVLLFDQLTFQKEIQQFTDQMPAINAKLARDDAKIKAQQMEKEALSRSLNGVTESKAKAQQECEVLQRKHGDLQKQLANMEAEQKNLSMYPEQKRALQKIKDGLVRETAALKAELRNLKPGPQAIAPKVCVNLWNLKRKSNISSKLSLFIFVTEIVPGQEKCFAETQSQEDTIDSNADTHCIDCNGYPTGNG